MYKLSQKRDWINKVSVLRKMVDWNLMRAWGMEIDLQFVIAIQRYRSLRKCRWFLGMAQALHERTLSCVQHAVYVYQLSCSSGTHHQIFCITKRWSLFNNIGAVGQFCFVFTNALVLYCIVRILWRNKCL